MRLNPLDPRATEIRIGIAHAHFFLGRYDEAASWAAMALQDNPDNQGGLRIAAASGCGNSIPRYVFPISRTCWALIGVPKTSRDTEKDCGKPGCPNDHRSQVLARGDEVIE